MQSATATTSNPARRHRRAAVAAGGWSLPPNVDIRSRAEAAELARWFAVVAAVLVVVGLAHVWLASQARELDYDRMAAHQVVRRLELEARDLEAKVEALQRHDRIERIAREQLGMVRPVAGQRQELP